MTDSIFPNESAEYRSARNALLKEEEKLIAKVKEVSALRRKLPIGGKLKEDYVFRGAGSNSLNKEIKFSDLFGDKSTLLLYAFMFGPGWDKPCMSCTSLVDCFDRANISVNYTAAFSVVAKAPANRIDAWAKERGWTNINLLSAEHNTYLFDYKCQGPDNDDVWPIMNVFTKTEDGIYHFWSSEMKGNHVDMVWPYWNLMDMTPEGRPDLPTPPQNFRSEFLTRLINSSST